jgi:hypothetical protein
MPLVNPSRSFCHLVMTSLTKTKQLKQIANLYLASVAVLSLSAV